MLAPLSLIAVLLAVAVTAQPTTAEAHPGKRQGLTFQDVSPLRLNWKEATEGLRRIGVCNLDKKPAELLIAKLTGFRVKRGHDVVSDEEVWKEPKDANLKDIAGGACEDLAVVAKGTRPKPATYKGVLVITSAGHGGARRRVVLKVGEKQTTQTTKTPEIAAKPKRILPKTVKDFSVGGVNFVPSLLNPLTAASFNAGIVLALILVPFSFTRFRPPWLKTGLLLSLYGLALILAMLGGWYGFGKDNDAYFEGAGPSAVDMLSPMVDKGAARGAVGSLVGKDGTVAMAVVRTDGQLDVVGIPRSGAYDGTVDLLPDDKDAGSATMTANVRDYWPYALLVIAAGVLLGYLVTRYFTQRSRALLILDLEDFRAEFQAISKDFCDRLPGLCGSYGVTDRLDDRLTEITKLLNRHEPEDIKQAGEDLKAVQTYFAKVRELWAQVEKIPDAATAVRSDLARCNLDIDAAQVPALKRADRLLKTKFDNGLPDEDSTALTDLRKDVDETVALLKELEPSLRQAAKVLHAIDAIDSSAWKENADKETLTRAKGSVRTAADGLAMAPTAEDATTRMSTVASELGAVRRLLRRVDPAALARLEEAVKGAPPPLPPSGESTAFTFEDFAPSAAPAEQTPAQRRRQFERIDRQWTLASGVLAVFSGLLALYVVTPTWGTPGDYLKALLWGSVVSEGTKAVTALVAKTSVSSS